MDFSVKVTAETGPDQRDGDNESQTDVASSPLVEQPEGTHPCPACPLVLASSRDLTTHLRGHNSPRSISDCSGEEVDYACGVCHKVLSSASSLDRHVLVHSGERPFKCKYCDMAFTTNGNMNRHLRTAHRALSPSHSCTDSEGSCDSERPLKRRLIQEEYNNNEVAKRNSPELVAEHGKRKCPDYGDELDGGHRRHKILLGSGRADLRGGYAEAAQCTYSCAVCGRQDFATSALLEAHLERSHPDVPAKCESCNLSFKNHRALNLHRFMIHFSEHGAAAVSRNLRNSVVGFNDLTFVDFSSDKFPAIARAVCEQSLHRPASGETPRYQCSKCLRAFPCRSALDAHETECGLLPLDATGRRIHEEQQSTRDDFFAGLDLQNKAALVEAKEGKDLADIQSIISVTSGPILQSFSRSDASTPDNCKIKQSLGSSGSSGTPSSEYHEEEAQDAFAAEFRKMKLKGEFPCRLCTAVFPNLRALKGHNRAHMGVGPGMPYPCNMCPYSSTDKATLVRHLRSHNGDRPYECSLCNYAFTTKANCERHVRNRHGKLSREEIKSVLIYHPSEDSTNDSSLERSSPRGLARDDIRKTLVYSSERDDMATLQQHQHQQQQHQQLHYPGEIRIKDEAKLRQPGLAGLASLHHAVDTGHYDKSGDVFSRPSAMQQPLELTYRADELDKPRRGALKSLDDDLDSRSSDGSVSLVSETKADAHQRIQASPMDLKKSNGNDISLVDGDAEAEDAPLDLTMDVLDLSKKAAAAAAVAAAIKDSETAGVGVGIGVGGAGDINGNAEDLSGNHKDLYNTTNQLLLTQALLKAGQVGAAQPSSLETFYANAHMIYRNFGTFSGVGAGILQPYLFNPHLFSQDFAMKERLQKELVRGLQTSGGSLVEPPAPGYVAAFPPARNPPPTHSANEPSDYPSMIPSKLMSKSMSPREKLEAPPSANSVKMVIKNGVLMPKQKQRRYRTERPFTCEHCSARFTLRSNMERHIKQQHPQHWSQRPRGGHSTRGRPPTNPPTLLQNLGQQSTAHQQIAHSYSNLLPKVGQLSTADYGKHAISDQVKYAILAQQLKGNKQDDNDTDEELIIDEESAGGVKESAAKEPTERTLSLLRGKLEANIECKGGEDRQSKEARRRGSAEQKLRIKEEAGARDVGPNSVKAGESAESENEEGPNELLRKVAVKSEAKVEVKAEQNESEDLASVSEILDNASQHYQQFQSQYMSDEEGLVASTSDCNQSGSDEKSDSINSGNSGNSSTTKKKKKMKKKKKKKKSAYSMAPNRVICPYCERPFPWTSSLRRHILTHTGQKPYQCMHCSLLFTTKSNCDRHLLRKHKANANKIRRARSTSSPEAQEAPANNNGQFSMRNVPERPYKCNQCPSSTFSTLGNLKKHRSTKHARNAKSRPESPSSETHNSPDQSPSECTQECQPECTQETSRDYTQDCSKQQQQQQHHQQSNDQSGYESQSSGDSENLENGVPGTMGPTKPTVSASANGAIAMAAIATATVAATSTAIATTTATATPPGNDASRSRRGSPRSSPGPTAEAPFKCHLCDSGFAERQDCLEHIKDNHERSYEMLVAKGALDMDIESHEEQMPSAPQPPPQPSLSLTSSSAPSSSLQHPSDGEERRGRFPDYSNRKVVCAFCMRRFWSAEDLRRHMRTHTGERPFSCDICCRRFTLKHSMLRHRKKHESVDSTMYVGTSGDEDNGSVGPMTQPPTITPRSQHQPGASSAGSACLPQVGSVATGDAAPNCLMRFNNPYEKLTTLTGKLTAGVSSSLAVPDANDNTDNDLISNLLGIRDKSIIDRVLQASADDAAKLLGVKGNHE